MKKVITLTEEDVKAVLREKFGGDVKLVVGTKSVCVDQYRNDYVYQGVFKEAVITLDDKQPKETTQADLVRTPIHELGNGQPWVPAGSYCKPWPESWPRHYQGREPCDMLVGPCCCGATHFEGEFKIDLRNMQEVILRNGSVVAYGADYS